jgi:hypothetical protein
MTLGEVKLTRANEVVGVCTDKPAFLALVNEATERLMVRGNFWNTVKKLRTCVRCRSLVWPRAVDQVLALNVCGVPVANSGYWWQFLPMNGTDYGALRGWGYFGAGGIGRGTCGNVVIQHDGTVPVQAQLTCGNPRYIRAYASYQADLGKTVTIFGIDDNGQTIMTKRADGTWQPGVVLTLASPYVGTPFLVREVTRVLKDATQGPVRLFAYDATNDVLEDMATYAPSERSPAFLHSTVRGLRRHTLSGSPACSGITSVEALVKLRFIAVETDEDEVLIDNWVALKQMMLAIRAEDAGDDRAAEVLQAKAVRELNRELRVHIPDDQIPIAITPFGSATPRSIGVGTCV